MGVKCQFRRPMCRARLISGMNGAQLWMQVLKDVSKYVEKFAQIFVTRTLAACATLQGLVTLRKVQPEVYKIVSLQMKAKTAERQRVSLTVLVAPSPFMM